MNIIKTLEFVTNKLRTKLFPTLREKEVSRYFMDGGDERFRYEFELSKDSIVLDLGGYKGQWASDIYAIYNCKILVFEPVGSYFKKIAERFRNNNQIEVFCLALGDQNKKEEIGLDDDGSSLYNKSNAKETIEFQDVAEFFSKQNIQNIDLLKVNIEGGEYALLKRLIETGLITKIKQLHVQFHDFIPNAEAQMNDLAVKLGATHNLTLQYKFVWENWVRKS